jgi:hypothetical protein
MLHEGSIRDICLIRVAGRIMIHHPNGRNHNQQIKGNVFKKFKQKRFLLSKLIKFANYEDKPAN